VTSPSAPTQPFAHQDASGAAGAPMAVFVDGAFVECVNEQADPYGYDAIARILERAAQPMRVEALIVCINHPTTAAVDCIICDPMED
jgi:hypothetical protein